MKFGEFGSIKTSKIEALRTRIEKLKVNLNLVEESFVRGSGKGGQKINKTSNAVQLHYPPLKITVKNQCERQRSANRFLALRELVDQIEMEVSPQTSSRLKEINRIRKQKARRKRRAFKKGI